MLNEKDCIGKTIIRRLEDIGKIRSLVIEILDMDCFRDLSKHNPYYQSHYELEAEKLDELRCLLSSLQDKACHIFEIIDQTSDGI